MNYKGADGERVQRKEESWVCRERVSMDSPKEGRQRGMDSLCTKAGDETVQFAVENSKNNGDGLPDYKASIARRFPDKEYLQVL